jgi:glycosyltransferase involved in cell wall biosynthesis
MNKKKLNFDIIATVIILTYNHKQYIEQALESVISQEVNFDYEIIVRDDCSNDGTSEIIAEYAKNHRNIIHQYNQINQFGSKTEADFIEKLYNITAKGKYIFHLDGDDLWTDCLKMQKQVDLMDADPSCSFCFHDWMKVDSNGLQTNESMPVAFKRDLSSDALRRFQYAWILMGTCCYRNCSIEWPLEVSISLSKDMFIPYIYGEIGYGKYVENISPLYYRQHDGGVWSSLNEAQRAKNKSITALMMLSILIRNGDCVGAAQQFLSRVLPALKQFGILEHLRTNK